MQVNADFTFLVLDITTKDFSASCPTMKSLCLGPFIAARYMFYFLLPFVFVKPVIVHVILFIWLYDGQCNLMGSVITQKNKELLNISWRKNTAISSELVGFLS